MNRIGAWDTREWIRHLVPGVMVGIAFIHIANVTPAMNRRGCGRLSR